MLHPLIRAARSRGPQRWRPAGLPISCSMIPLLVESGELARPRVERVLVVDCTEATQIARVCARPAWTGRRHAEYLAAQATRAARLAAADDVIFNERRSTTCARTSTRLHWITSTLATDGSHANIEMACDIVERTATEPLCMAIDDRGPLRVSVQRTYPHAAPARRPVRQARSTSAGSSTPYDHHTALMTLFEILEVTSRADLKSDLLQELERHKQSLNRASKQPAGVRGSAGRRSRRHRSGPAGAQFDAQARRGQHIA